MTKTLVFMAAGFGSRFGGGVKQLEPVGPNGEVLMDYAVYDALRAGFDRVVFIVRRELEPMFRAGVGRRTEARCAVEYVHQELDDLPVGFALPAGRTKPWGTGQAVLACRNVLDGPFCVLNADDYYGAEAFARIHDFLYGREGAGLELCMAGYVLGNTLSESGAVTRGLCRVRPDGHLDAIRETRGIVIEGGAPCVTDPEGVTHRLPSDAVVSMNIWGMPLAFLDYLREGFERFLRGIPAGGELRAEYLVPSVVGEMVASGRGSVRVLPTHDHWFGMTYAEDKRLTQQRIRELIAEGYYQ